MARVKIVNVDEKTVVVKATSVVNGEKVHHFEVDLKPHTYSEYFILPDMNIELEEKQE